MHKNLIANKRQVSITWLSNFTLGEIDFRLGDNGTQLFYEAEKRGITWVVLRPKTARYWVVIAERKGCLKTLNCCVEHNDGTVEKDPLYHQAEYTEDFPVALLESLVNYIYSGADPFSKQ